MTNGKRICPNCGAYLKDEDKVCYVCGEVLPAYTPAKAEEQTVLNTSEQKINEDRPQQDYSEAAAGRNNDLPKDSENEVVFEPEERMSFDDAEPYYEEEKEMKKGKKSKKAALVCTICVVVVALIALGVGLCYNNGIFGGQQEEKTEITIYFDKPSSSLNLMDENGVVYNWGADVAVNYVLEDKTIQSICNPCDDYENMWKCTIPADAQDVYFSQNTTEEIRTQNIVNLQDETVYYVTEILFNSDFRLPLSSCALNEFNNLGVNATEESLVTVTTAAPSETEETSESETETTETESETTEPDTQGGEPYSVSIPTSWSSGTTVVQKGNCTTYYETYNYKNYQSGMLLSIYVYDSGDNSYGDMNVKKVLTTSDGSKKIVIVTPTDIQFNDSDDTAITNYSSLSNSTNQVISSITAQ